MQPKELEIPLQRDVLVNTALNFPCFSEADPNLGVDKIFNIIVTAYQDDNLTEEQDLVVELILHLFDEESPFDLKRAMTIWSPEDRAAFINILQKL